MTAYRRTGELTMTSRERLLTALNNEKPDHLPCQVHSWMDYYLKTYLAGRDQFQAYEYFKGMDWVIYASPEYIYSPADQANWQIKVQDFGYDADGIHNWHETIETPGGTLTQAHSSNQFTSWTTEYIIKDERDFEIWRKYIPLPVKVDWTPILEIKKRIGDKGIVRSGFFGFGQGSPWQDFCTMFSTEDAIMATFDKKDWMHFALKTLLDYKLKVIDRAGKIELDLVETGGGAGSSTVISPALHREFCLPYDQVQHKALHAARTKVVYHLCGGLMPLLEIVVENGTDGLETMTPPAMGGDCELAEASRRVGQKLFFIGGFDQNAGFEKGTPAKAAELIHACHNACPDGGYICCPSDHFFFGDPANIQAFVDEANRCRY
jgi:uroporphyrinogen-III decarboxylase